MYKIRKIYEIVRDFLEAENVSLNAITLYEELIYINKVYELGLDEETINKLHKFACDYYFRYDGNPSMYCVASATLVYYRQFNNFEEFAKNFSKHKFFEYINEAMEV